MEDEIEDIKMITEEGEREVDTGETGRRGRKNTSIMMTRATLVRVYRIQKGR